MAQTLPSAPPAVGSSPSDRANPLWPWILMGTAGGLGVGLGLYCLRRTSAQPRPLHRDATPPSSPVTPIPNAATPKVLTHSRSRGKTQGKRRPTPKPSASLAPTQAATQAAIQAPLDPHQQSKHKPSGPVVPPSKAATAPQGQGKPMERSPLSSVPPPPPPPYPADRFAPGSPDEWINQELSVTKISRTDALLEQLQSRDAQKRRQAIWELGQRGTSDAIQPLVDALVDSDSQQRSLILGAIAEIGTRTLSPINHALMISLQDSNTDVRKNAIRDLTRIYTLMAQMSQILAHAALDRDAEVQATALWALEEFNQVCHPSNLRELNASETHPVYPLPPGSQEGSG